MSVNVNVSGGMYVKECAREHTEQQQTHTLSYPHERIKL